MSRCDLTLPDLEVARDARSLYGRIDEVFIDCLRDYPTAVVHGMRRALEQLERAGVPAFADGRRLWTPQGSFFVNMSGQLSRKVMSIVDFEARARHAVQRMAERNGFSFNQTFVRRFVKEDAHAQTCP